MALLNVVTVDKSSLISTGDPTVTYTLSFDEISEKENHTNKIFEQKSYIGYNCALEFNKYIIDISQRVMKLGCIEMNNLTKEEWKEYDENKKCPACMNEYSYDRIKVRDHDHWTGEYRGPLCQECNLKKYKNKLDLKFGFKSEINTK